MTPKDGDQDGIACCPKLVMRSDSSETSPLSDLNVLGETAQQCHKCYGPAIAALTFDEVYGHQTRPRAMSRPSKRTESGERKNKGFAEQEVYQP